MFYSITGENAFFSANNVTCVTQCIFETHRRAYNRKPIINEINDWFNETSLCSFEFIVNVMISIIFTLTCSYL